MKRITLAALVLGGFAASAQAQSNVTVYGLVDLGLVKVAGSPTLARENHASRLGFKGGEDLGNGVSALFSLESEILADTGAQKGNLFERQAHVGLKGAFGAVHMGRTKGLIDSAQARVDPFGADGVVGKVDEATLRVGVSRSRVNDAVTYHSPNLGGVVVSAQYVLSEMSGAAAGLGLLVTYDNGPLSAHAGYEESARTALSAAKPGMYVLGGAYQFGAAKVSGAYAKGDTDDAAKGKYTGYLAGLIYTIGHGDIKAAYGKQDQQVAGVDKEVLNGFGVGYDHHLSKRTDLYAYAGRERVKSINSYQMGISHKF